MLTWYGTGVLLSTVNRTVPQWQLPSSVTGMSSRSISVKLLKNDRITVVLTGLSSAWNSLYKQCHFFCVPPRRLATLVVSQNFPLSTQCHGLYESLFTFENKPTIGSVAATYRGRSMSIFLWDIHPSFQYTPDSYITWVFDSFVLLVHVHVVHDLKNILILMNTTCPTSRTWPHHIYFWDSTFFHLKHLLRLLITPILQVLVECSWSFLSSFMYITP